MQASTQSPARESQVPNQLIEVSRLDTVTDNKLPHKCFCRCGLHIPHDPEVRYVVDFRVEGVYT